MTLIKNYTITAPIINCKTSYIEAENCIRFHQIYYLYELTNKSPISYKIAAEKIARYFRMEFGYDCSAYHSRSKIEDNEKMYLILDDAYEPCAIGFIIFLLNEETREWYMEIIWLHHYRRREGILTKLWPIFKDKFGEFRVSHPVSDAMKAFLIKNNYIFRYKVEVK